MKVCDEKFAKRWCVEGLCASTYTPRLQSLRYKRTVACTRRRIIEASILYSRRQPKNKKAVCVTARARPF